MPGKILPSEGEGIAALPLRSQGIYIITPPTGKGQGADLPERRVSSRLSILQIS